MATKLAKTTCMAIFLFLFFSPCLGSLLSTIFNSPDPICNFTPYPDFCRNVHPHDMHGTITDFGLVSISQSITEAKDFQSSIDDHIRRLGPSKSSTVLALQDCKDLGELSQDYMSNALKIIGSANGNLESTQVDEVQSLLSAILTNQETCLDGLQESSSWPIVKDGLMVPISNGMKLYSVSLALFTKGYVPEANRQRWLLQAGANVNLLNKTYNATINFSPPPVKTQVSVNVNGRRLLQTVKDNVLVSQRVVVNPDGSGNFTTISDAVAAAPNNTDARDGYFVIYVVAGVYEEYVNIAKNKMNLMMIGDGINQTVITGNRSVVDGWTTFSSATFVVVGKGFVAVNITFRNTAGAIKHQAVAVRNGADMSTFYRCSFEGYQDTLYAHSLRQFYRECDIYGTVDFIFGNAAVVLQNCNIYPRLPLQNQFSAITAQGRIDPNQNTGISIHNCNIRTADDLRYSDGTTKTYLGRPWKEYSRTVYLQSFMDGLIDPPGWIAWSGDFALSTLYYAEFSNTGPGSDTSRRVTWPGYYVINATEAAKYTVSSFIKGNQWLTGTGVPFTAGLL